MKTIKWGILATGKITEALSKAMKYLESKGECELLAVASRSEEKAKAFAESHSIKRYYKSYEELVKDDDIDVVYIASPMSCHYENAKLCLSNGKNVLCEKTVTMDTNEFNKLVSLAKEKDLFFMEAMWMKFLPAFRQAISWINDGKIGEVKMIRADFSNIVKYDENDRLFRKDLGGGAILDLGVYPLTLVTAILGFKPKEIISNSFVGRTGVDFDDSIILKYDNAVGVTFCGFDFENENKAIIVGTKGRIVFGNWFFCSGDVTLFDDMANIIKEKHFNHECNGYEYELREVNKCLAEGKKESDINTLQNTLDNLKIMEYCLNQINN